MKRLLLAIAIMAALAVLPYIWLAMSASQETNPGYDVYVVTAKTVNIREQPNTKSKVITSLNKGSLIAIENFSPDGQWARTPQQEWVNAQYIKYKQRGEVKPHSKIANITKTLAYYGGFLALLECIVFLIPAIKRIRIIAHLVGPGLSAAIMLFVAQYDWGALGFLLINGPLWVAIAWPVLYLSLKPRQFEWASLAAIIAMIFSVYKMSMLDGSGTGMAIFNAIVMGGINLLYFFAILMRQEDNLCPYCGYYATHRLDKGAREYTGTTHSHDEMDNPFADEYDHTEVTSDKIIDYYIAHPDVYTYQHDHYIDTRYCARCHRPFKQEKTITRLLGVTKG